MQFSFKSINIVKVIAKIKRGPDFMKHGVESNAFLKSNFAGIYWVFT